MPSALVSESRNINKSDSVIYRGKECTFSLYDRNTTGEELILIYMYILPRFQQHGIKVGMTKCRINEEFWHAIKTRVGVQVHELALSDEQYRRYGYEREVIYWGICLDAKSEMFKDYSVHDEILNVHIGITEKEQEWFTNIPQDELIEAFEKVRHRTDNKEIFTPRKEQRACIDKIAEYFVDNPKDGRFLLNCKMRFGKSFTTYKYCEEAYINKILILTFVPAVEESWADDLKHIKKGYKYLTDEYLKSNVGMFGLDSINEPFVLFLSLQNYLGKDKNSYDTKAKIKQLQDIYWDIVILDEYHFGAWNQRTQGTFKTNEEFSEDLDSTYEKELRKTKEDVIEHFGIRTKNTICLSGTPFKALAKGEFNDTSSFTYSYFDEQRNKYPKSEEGDMKTINPDYAAFPDMKIFGYNMNALFKGLAIKLSSKDKLLSNTYFSLNKFFETKKENNPNEPCRFIYEDEINEWLEVINGRSAKNGANFPFSNPAMRNNSKHSLWLMPTVDSCLAMENLLKENEYFSKYQIINLSKDGVGAGKSALKYLEREMTAAKNTDKLGSIAITVNKLTIGVTVKKWSSVFVLKDLASPEQYFQAIFRIQTPYKGKDGSILKKIGYVYDFNIDRASALILKYAEQSAEDKKSTKLEIARLIVKYMPIYMNGNMENPIDESVFYQLAEFGDTSGTPLSKRIANTEATTRVLDEETIAEMLNDKDVSDIIKRVFAHAKFKNSKERKIPPKPEDGFDSAMAKKGRDIGYDLGKQDSSKYIDYDDTVVQCKFEEAIAGYILEYCPKDYDENGIIWFSNGFRKGYESGVNAPIRKTQCGKEDGERFVSVVKKRFGENIKYTNGTKSDIENFEKTYLNDIHNIPEKYRGMLYKRWYCESFRRAVKTKLTPVIDDKETKSIEDTDNVLKHILARLFEFLYISVYRETTFQEIFKNADPNIFLEAVGITKKEFEVLNKYKIFQEDVLNNYIHEFFVNESLGSRLDLNDEEIQKQYRNSFDWFGFGLVNEDKTIEIPYAEALKVAEEGRVYS